MASGESATTIYGFTVKDIDGNEISLEKYRYDFSVPIYGVHFFFFLVVKLHLSLMLLLNEVLPPRTTPNFKKCIQSTMGIWQFLVFLAISSVNKNQVVRWILRSF